MGVFSGAMKNILHISFLIVSIWLALLAMCILPVCVYITYQFGGSEIIIGFLSPFFLIFAAMVNFEIASYFAKNV